VSVTIVVGLGLGLKNKETAKKLQKKCQTSLILCGKAALGLCDLRFGLLLEELLALLENLECFVELGDCLARRGRLLGLSEQPLCGEERRACEERGCYAWERCMASQTIALCCRQPLRFFFYLF